MFSESEVTSLDTDLKQLKRERWWAGIHLVPHVPHGVRQETAAGTVDAGEGEWRRPRETSLDALIMLGRVINPKVSYFSESRLFHSPLLILLAPETITRRPEFPCEKLSFGSKREKS